ncbi:hypothetical protein [Halobacillus amylolyticus]|uniref:Spore coat protein n=1 Tax=Halobacillus amylolyticus TaxID=2932259 RepID=A0ABY4HF53_9BACI|nr:hypothetical protein [Halobacillus amylolyticus]UOR13507.1 hypothetical protein MUO15_08650 [Halobacillus amylolyticus]
MEKMHHGMNASHMGNMPNNQKHVEQMYKLCQKHKNQKVHMKTFSGDSFNVYIDHVDVENVHVTLASQRPGNSSRQWGYGYGGGYGPGYGPGYGYGGYGGGYGYGGIGSFLLPLTAIAGLSAGF